ncbi:hypothetical protein GW17_00027381 [Ensete ventricosum]|nr:hypothetical protein GW17_00027381 [Ensete ventricosum]
MLPLRFPNSGIKAKGWLLAVRLLEGLVNCGQGSYRGDHIRPGRLQEWTPPAKIACKLLLGTTPTGRSPPSGQVVA